MNLLGATLLDAWGNETKSYRIYNLHGEIVYTITTPETQTYTLKRDAKPHWIEAFMSTKQSYNNKLKTVKGV